MRKLFTILFLIPFVVFSQTDSLNQTDGNGLKQGRWKKFYLKGGKRYVGQFKDDKPIGTFFYYDELGKMTSSLKHKGDTAFGKFFHIHVLFDRYTDQVCWPCSRCGFLDQLPRRKFCFFGHFVLPSSNINMQNI